MSGFIVTTTDGHTAAKSSDEKRPWTENEAAERAKRANDQAKKLGIKARYEVVKVA